MRLGEWNVSSERDCYLDECSPPVLDIPVEEAIAHEGYNPVDGHQQNDIALLRLEKEVRISGKLLKTINQIQKTPALKLLRPVIQEWEAQNKIAKKLKKLF